MNAGQSNVAKDGLYACEDMGCNTSGQYTFECISKDKRLAKHVLNSWLTTSEVPKVAATNGKDLPGRTWKDYMSLYKGCSRERDLPSRLWLCSGFRGGLHRPAGTDGSRISGVNADPTGRTVTTPKHCFRSSNPWLPGPP